MKQHILLKNAFYYEKRDKIELPDNYTFDDNKGYWIDNVNNEIMMLSKNAKKPQTKKADLETGEDQKGE